MVKKMLIPQYSIFYHVTLYALNNMITCPQKHCNIIVCFGKVRTYLQVEFQTVLFLDISCMPLLFGEGLMVLHVDEKACQLFIIAMIVALLFITRTLRKNADRPKQPRVQMHCLSSINLPPVLAYRLFLTDAHIHSSRLQSLTHIPQNTTISKT